MTDLPLSLRQQYLDAGFSPEHVREIVCNPILAFVVMFIERHRMTPTIAEIARGLGIDQRVAWYRIDKLVDEGKLIRSERGRVWIGTF